MYQPKYKVGTGLTGGGNFWSGVQGAFNWAQGGDPGAASGAITNVLDRINRTGGEGGAGEGGTAGGDFGGQTLGGLADATAIGRNSIKGLATLGAALGLPGMGLIGMAAPAIEGLTTAQAEAAQALGAAMEGFSAATGINTSEMSVDEAQALTGVSLNSVEAITDALNDTAVQAQATQNSQTGVAGHGFGGYGAGSGDSPSAIGGHDTSDADAFGGFGGFSDATAEADNPGSTGVGSNDGGGGGGDGKIVCTALNDMYGFGSYRNRIWLEYDRVIGSKQPHADILARVRIPQAVHASHQSNEDTSMAR
jgi:hypothetical protein